METSSEVGNKNQDKRQSKAMQKQFYNAEVIKITKTEGNYGTSRFNALSHGACFRNSILPWEKKSDYDNLLKSLMQEYQPMTPTENHFCQRNCKYSLA